MTLRTVSGHAGASNCSAPQCTASAVTSDRVTVLILFNQKVIKDHILLMLIVVSINRLDLTCRLGHFSINLNIN